MVARSARKSSAGAAKPWKSRRKSAAKRRLTWADSVALSVGKIEADSSGEVIDPPAPVAATEVGVRRLPVPAGGDRRRGALASALRPVLSRH